MKYLDSVRLISDKYSEKGYYKGAIGAIILPEIRMTFFEVEFFNVPNADSTLVAIDVADLEVVEPSDMTDQQILEDLPTPNPKWWCKVEDGYIVNLLGERKNKVPFDYNS